MSETHPWVVAVAIVFIVLTGALALLTPTTLIRIRRETAIDQPDAAGRYPYRTTGRRLGAALIVMGAVLTYGLLVGGWWAETR